MQYFDLQAKKRNGYWRKSARKLISRYLGCYLSQLLFGTRPEVVIFLAEIVPVAVLFTAFTLIRPALMFNLCGNVSCH